MDTIFVDNPTNSSGVQVREYQAVERTADLLNLKAEPGQFVFVRSCRTVYSLQCNLWTPVVGLEPYSLAILTRPQESLLYAIREAGEFLLFQKIDGELVSIDNEHVINPRRTSVDVLLREGYLQIVSVGGVEYIQAIPQRLGGRSEIRYRATEFAQGTSFLADEIADGSTRGERLQGRVVE